MLHVASVWTPCCMLLRVVGSCCTQSLKQVKLARCKRTQQLPASVCTGLQRVVGCVQSWPKGFGTQPLFDVFLNGICCKRAILTHKRGWGGGGDQLEMHFLHLKHSVTNILTRTVVNCYILLLHTAYHVERAPMKKPLFNKLSGPWMVQSFRPSIVSVQ